MPKKSIPQLRPRDRRPWTREEQRQARYIMQRGWAQSDESAGDFADPKEPRADRALHGLSYAYKIQHERDRLAAGLSYFRVFPRFQRFGFRMVEFTKKGVKEGSTRRIDRKYSAEEDELRAEAKRLNDSTTTPRWPKRPAQDRTNYNRVLILEDKHATYHYNADSIEQLYAACLDIVVRNNGQHYYDDLKSRSTTEVETPDLTKEQIAALPQHSSVRRAAEHQWEAYEGAQTREPARKEMRGRLEIALDKTQAAERRGAAAAALVFDRKDHEYESVSLENLVDALDR